MSRAGPEPVSASVVVGGGAFFSPHGCAVLHRLACAGLVAEQQSNGGGEIPASTAAYIAAAKAGARIDAGQGGALMAVVDGAGTNLDGAPVLGSRSDGMATPSETARRWGMNPDGSFVRRLARAGRLPGAVLVQGVWNIPSDVPRPRRRSA